MRRIHFLHIGKTGGVAVRHALAPFARSHNLALYSHRKTLRDLPAGEGVVIFARDPVTRFVSGFNSRLRMGRPRLDKPWTPGEVAAFAAFASPAALADALASESMDTRAQAEGAMGAIAHLSRTMTGTLGDEAYVASRRPDIVMIGFQESLSADFERLKTILGLPESTSLPADDVAAHRTPPGFDTALSPAGRVAIEAWYRDDIALFRYLKTLGAAS